MTAEHLQETVDLAHRLAKSGLVREAAGLPDFPMFAEDDLLVDPAVFKNDLEARLKVFRDAWKNIENGVAALGAREPPVAVKDALALVRRRIKEGYHAYACYGDNLAFHEAVPAKDYATTLPGQNRKKTLRDERVRITFTDAQRVKFEYGWYADGVPIDDKRFTDVWARLKAADNDGVLYEHRYNWRRGHSDEPMLTHAGRDFVKYHSAPDIAPKTLILEDTVSRMEEIADAVPGMHTRERIRERLLAGEEGWKIADRFADALASLPETAQYAQLLNIFGTGTWHKSSEGPYFTSSPDFSSTRPRDLPSTVRNALEQGLTGNHRAVFKGYDFKFLPRSVDYDLQGFVKDGKLKAEQTTALQKQAGDFVAYANRMFKEF